MSKTSEEIETGTFKIEGMHCASCANAIKKAAEGIKGVQSAQINFATETGTFEKSPQLSWESLKQAVAKEGYQLQDSNTEQKSDVATGSRYRNFIVSITLSLIVFVLAMTPLGEKVPQKINWLIQALLVLPIWSWFGRQFQQALFQFFRSGKSNMNTLIGLGTSAAFLYSLFITFFTSFSERWGLSLQVYYEAVGFITSFVMLGKILEDKAKKKARSEMNALYRLSAGMARVVEGDGVREVEVEDVQKGMILRVKPGEKIPVDGKVVSGKSSIDESLITGESAPVDKEEGNEVYSGTINGEGSLDFKATKVGKDTFLSHVVNFVEQAQLNQAPIQRYADKISSYFVPAVIAASVVTFLSWFFFGPDPIWGNSLSSMIAVLVIACPCALGLATPTAVVVATGKASREGLLIGGGEVIEKGSHVDAIIFDKTGTVTHGRPEVETFVSSGKFKDREVFKWVASVENFSEHPLSKAILQYTQEKGEQGGYPESFETIAGRGIKAQVEGHQLFVGNPKLLQENRISTELSGSDQLQGTLVYVAVDGELAGCFSLVDQIKDEAKETIEKLHRLGVECWMVSGDREEVANLVAKELGIDHVIAQALPDDKLKKMKELQESGKKVAMIGDGINDAPALAQADLSMAMGSGTDVAMEASDVVIAKGVLKKVTDFLDLSHHTMRVIRQNLFLSMVYNTLCIPLAAGLSFVLWNSPFPPVLASLAMGLSSISVVTNSLRAGRNYERN